MNKTFTILLSSLLLSPLFPQEETITLGIYPYEPATILIRKFQPLAAHIESRTGWKVMFSIANSYEDHMEAVAHGLVDLAYIEPANYVKLVNKYGAHPIIGRIAIKGVPYFRGAIVVRDDSPIRELNDLSHKTYAASSRNSTMSYIVPMAFLVRNGVRPQDITAQFVGKHDNVALGVLIGDFHAGGIKETTFRKYESQGLRILEWLPTMSEHLFIMKRDTDEQRFALLKKILLELDRIDVLDTMRPGATAIVEARHEDYRNLEELLRLLDDPDATHSH